MLIAFAHLRVDLKLLIREAGGVLMTHSERPHSSLGYRAPNARSPEWRCDSARCVFFAVRFGAQAPPPDYIQLDNQQSPQPMPTTFWTAKPKANNL